MADRTINSRAFRTEFIRLTERTAVTANNRVIGIWHPVSVPIFASPDRLEIDGEAMNVTLMPAPRPDLETPAADVPSNGAEPKDVSEVRTRGQAEALDESSLVTAVGASEGGSLAAGGSTNSSASTRRAAQAKRDKILRGVNRGNMP